MNSYRQLFLRIYLDLILVLIFWNKIIPYNLLWIEADFIKRSRKHHNNLYARILNRLEIPFRCKSRSTSEGNNWSQRCKSSTIIYKIWCRIHQTNHSARFSYIRKDIRRFYHLESMWSIQRNGCCGLHFPLHNQTRYASLWNTLSHCKTQNNLTFSSY